MDRARRAAEQGFSLLEMVVVVAVIAVLSVTATFAVTDRSRGEGDVIRFAATYDRLRDVAILSGVPQGLALLPDGWHILEPPRVGAQDDGWRPVGTAQKFRGEARFERDKRAIAPRELPPEPRPDITFLPDGQVSPFEVTFIGSATLSRCRSGGLSGLDCEGS